MRPRPRVREGVPGGAAEGSPDPRHTGASDRRDGGRRLELRAQGRRQAPQDQIRRLVTTLAAFTRSGVFMIRILAVFAALICAAPALAQPLPAGLDKSNTIVIDTSKGRIVFKLRTDLTPQLSSIIN